MVNRIGGGNGFGPLDGLNKAQKTGPKRESGKASGSDRVDFSSVLQSVSQPQEAATAQGTARAEKLANLKSQIASGQYRPNLEKVAERMLKLVVEDL